MICPLHLTDAEERMYNKIHDHLLSMKDGEIKKLDPNHSNYTVFVNCCKHFIDAEYDWLNGFSLTFNEAFTRIRKDFLN